MTRKIDVELKMIENCLIDRTWLITYNQVRSRVRVPELINNATGIDVQV